MLQFFRVCASAALVVPYTDLVAAVYQHSCQSLQGGPGSSQGRNGQGSLGQALQEQVGDKEIESVAVVTGPLGIRRVESLERLHKAFQLVDKIVQGVEFD
jgi:hypothetical protein